MSQLYRRADRLVTHKNNSSNSSYPPHPPPPSPPPPPRANPPATPTVFPQPPGNSLLQALAAPVEPTVLSCDVAHHSPYHRLQRQSLVRLRATQRDSPHPPTCARHAAVPCSPARGKPP